MQDQRKYKPKIPNFYRGVIGNFNRDVTGQGRNGESKFTWGIGRDGLVRGNSTGVSVPPLDRISSVGIKTANSDGGRDGGKIYTVDYVFPGVLVVLNPEMGILIDQIFLPPSS